MNQQIIDYLHQNKEQYAQDVLVAQLQHAGHSEEDIATAVVQVYGAQMPQTPEALVRYAGFWVRFAALMIDNIILFIVGLIFGFSIGFIFGMQSVFLTIGSYVIGWAYFIAMTHKYQATLGKKALGIKVQSVDSGNASLGKITLRETIGKIISGIIFGIGYIMVAFTGKKQALHDMIAKTVVVYKNPLEKNNVVAIIVIGVIIFLIIGGFFATIVLVSLNSAREKAKDASFKATASSVVPSAILCCDSYEGVKKSLNKRPGEKVCSPEDPMYPSVYPEDLTMITVEKNCDSNGNFILHVEPSPQKAGSCIGATMTQEGVIFDGCR